MAFVARELRAEFHSELGRSLVPSAVVDASDVAGLAESLRLAFNGVAPDNCQVCPGD